MSSIQVPEVADLEGMGPRELEQTLRDMDMIRRRAEAAIGEIVGAAERSGAYGEDGNASVAGWVKAVCNYSTGETRAVV
jgi:hypothetical protein